MTFAAPSAVMAGLDPATQQHRCARERGESGWVPGSSPGMTTERLGDVLKGVQHRRASALDRAVSHA